MKFLCLHGKGSSANILKSQTSSFRYKLPRDFDFEFVNGSYPCGPAAGLRKFYPGPYFAWYNEGSVEEARKTHTWLREYIKKHGPYDGVLGFSQGCGLLASFLLFHAMETPDEPLPFQTAIFICGGLTMPAVAEAGIEVTVEAQEWDDRSRLMLQQRASLLDRDANVGIDPWIPSPPNSETDEDLEGEEEEEEEQPDIDMYFRLHHPDHIASSFNDFASLKINPDKMDASDVFGLDFTKCSRESVPLIRIPTVHIYGSKDPRYPAAIQLTQFCDKRLRQCFDHRGGHEIPRTKKVSEKIADLVTWAAAMAEAF